MNATVWMLCFPHAMELWRDQCMVRDFCPSFYWQQTLHGLRMTQEECDRDMSHLVPMVRMKRSTLTLHWPRGKGLVLRGPPCSYFIGMRVQSFFSHQARVQTITPTYCPAHPPLVHDPFVMMNEEWFSCQTLECKCYQAAVDTLCRPRAMHLWCKHCLVSNLCPAQYDAMTFQDMHLTPGNCTMNVTNEDQQAALAHFHRCSRALRTPQQQRSAVLPHTPTNCISTDTPASRLHADLAMENMDLRVIVAAAQKYQEDCMVLAAQQLCNGRNACGLETCPDHFRHLTLDEFQVPPAVCQHIKSPWKKCFLGMLLGLFNLAHAKRYTDPTLKMLTKNVNTLRENQDQIHGDLAKLYWMVNLSKTELGEHRHLLHKLEQNAVTMHIRMDRVFDALGELQCQAIGQYLLTSAQIKLGTLQDGIHQYERAVTTLYDNLSAISTQTVTPAVLTPHQLHIVLRQVKEHILNQPKLALPGNPDADVWSYYGYIRAIPAIVGQTLLVSLQIPLADVSTTLCFYRVHSFPLLDPHTQQQFSYELESPYLAIAKTDYYTLPAETEVTLCIATRGKWC